VVLSGALRLHAAGVRMEDAIVRAGRAIESGAAHAVLTALVS
jgi:hypothetical protein